MKVNFITQLEGAEIIAPNDGDVGFDLVAASEPKIVGRVMGKVNSGEQAWGHIDYIEYDTGIIVEPEDKTLFSLLMPRSSASKYWLSLCNSVGLIDNGYRGTVKARFNYLWQPDNAFFLDGGGFVVNPDKIYKKGDKIAQLVFLRSLNSKIETAFKDTFTDTERGAGSFGSTGG